MKCNSFLYKYFIFQEQPVAVANAKRQIEPLHADEPTPTTKDLTNHIDDDSSESESDSDSDPDSEELPSKTTSQSKVQ